MNGLVRYFADLVGAEKRFFKLRWIRRWKSQGLGVRLSMKGGPVGHRDDL